jgi:hypothetical protein
MEAREVEGMHGGKGTEAANRMESRLGF